MIRRKHYFTFFNKTWFMRVTAVTIIMMMVVVTASDANLSMDPNPDSTKDRTLYNDNVPRSLKTVKYGVGGTPPMSDGFVKNVGQVTPPNISYYNYDGPRGIGFGTSMVTIVLPEESRPKDNRSNTRAYTCIIISFPQSSEVDPKGRCSLDQLTTYISNDPSGAEPISAPTYRSVLYEEIYTGIDLKYYWDNGSLKYDFIVRPGGDPSSIRMSYSGIDALEVDDDGALVIRSGSHEVRDEGLKIHQVIDGELLEISGSFQAIGDSMAKIIVDGTYSPNHTLVIDPILTFGTFIGGTEYDVVNDMVVDGTGNIYLTGITWSRTTFPITAGAYQQNLAGYWDIFVMKLNERGDKILFSTFIGTTTWEDGVGIAIDDASNVYLTGSTRDINFPTTAGAFDTLYNGRRDIFVLKMNPDGSSLIYSTFVGGSWFDYASDLDVDWSGNAFVTGWSFSDDFPTTSNAIGSTYKGNGDAVFIVLNQQGSNLVYSTYMGGEKEDVATRVQCVFDGHTLVTGTTSSQEFPSTDNRLQSVHSGEDDGFVLEFNIYSPDPIVYGTFIGGSGSDRTTGITLDDDDDVILAGTTDSVDFPTTKSALSQRLNGGTDGYVIKFQRPEWTVSFSTYLGGSANEDTIDLLVDNKGCPIVSGSTGSFNFPTLNWSFQPTKSEGIDTFVTRLSRNGDNILYSSFLGGTMDEVVSGISIDGMDNPILCGFTNSSDFPVDEDSYDNRYNGDGDGFVIKLDVIRPSFGNDTTDLAVETGEGLAFGVEVVDNVAVDAVWVDFLLSPGDINLTIKLNNIDNSIYTGTLEVPNDTEALTYRFHALDVFLNWNVTAWASVHIIDNEKPEILEDRTPDNGTTGDPFTFHAVASDNIGISSVHITYWYNDDAPKWNVSMAGIYDFEATIKLPLNSTEPMRYFISVMDLSGNWVMSGRRTVIIQDNDAPWFIRDLSENVGTTGDPYQLGTMVEDNIEVSEVWVSYWFAQSSRTRTMMENNITYGLRIRLPEDALPIIYYQFEAYDQEGNQNITPIHTVSISDNDPPKIISDLSDEYIGTGNIFSLRVEVEDNDMLSSVEVELWYDDTDLNMRFEMKRADIYWYEVLISSNATGFLHYLFITQDISGNMGESEQVTLTIYDDDTPVFLADHSDGIATTGDEFTFGVQVMDNIGVSTLLVVYQVGDGEETSLPMIGDTSTIRIPSEGSGRLSYRFEATDISGNTNTTLIRFLVIQDNDLPIAVAGFKKSVIQGDTVELDGTESTDNVGVVEWIWTISGEDGFHILTGPSVEFIFDREGKYTINLTVSDAFGNIDTNISWISVNCKDEPFYREQPLVLMLIIISVIALVSILWNRNHNRNALG